MKPTKKQRKEVDDAFEYSLKELILELRLYKDDLVNKHLVTQNLKFNHDFVKLGREALFFKLELIIAGDKLLEETKKLIDHKR